jgi:hypothetical protein
MKKTVKAWGLFNPGGGIYYSSIDTDKDRINLVLRSYKAIDKRFMARLVLITYDDGRGQQRRRGTR